MNKSIGILTLLLLLASCHEDEILNPELPENVIAGGATTVFSTGPDAYTFPLANLDAEGISRHFLADEAFGQQFVTAPSNQFGGLGPLFNQNSCESCHVRNGRGTIPQFEGDIQSGLLLRLSVSGTGLNGGPVPVPGFGGQLQNKAVFGTNPEGKLSKSETGQIIEYLDGLLVTLQKPTYSITDPYISLPSDVKISPRVAPPVHGLGLLEAITETDILSRADENDANADGISGKPNMVWDVLANIFKIGRFGWKAEQPTAGQQAAGAAHNDMGLTNFYFPEEHCTGQTNCANGLQSNVDIDEEIIELMAFYFQTLAVPARRNYDQPEVIQGATLFEQLKCVSCHAPKFTTGVHPISALSNQVIYPYTDLLLHNMGEELSDNRPAFSAEGNEWRTPPLWGIGLAKVVNPKATFLHDGRAKNLEEAILWHGGEAQNSKDLFVNLSKQERDALIAFLNSL